MKKIKIFLLLSYFLMAGDIQSINIFPKDFKSSYIKILDQKVLKYNSIDNISFSEISDLAYDIKNKILYMISDEGKLFKFRAIFNNKISLSPLEAYYLKYKNKRLKKSKRDSEAITINNRGNLYVAFEAKRFKIAQINKYGNIIKFLDIPKRYKKIKVRSSNKSVEALTFHPIYRLLFAFEYPPKGVKKCKQKIYSLFFKKSFNLNLIKHKRCAISAIESVDKDHILILERSFGGFFAPFFIDLILYDLKNKSSKLLLELNSGKGFLVDNFEGLAKVGKNRFVMVSDDNNNFFQNTILIYFEISAEALR